MFTVTVSDAAKILNVTRGRVNQLIQSGSLAAEKIGGIWLIDDASISDRAKLRPKAGRPREDSNRNLTGEYTLMNRTHEVLRFRFDPTTGNFHNITSVIDPLRAPYGIMSPRGKTASTSALSNWWAHRAIPKVRAGVESRLAEFGIKGTWALPLKNLGLSLSDQYWIRPAWTPDLDWHDINYFDNNFDSGSVDNWLDATGLNSPDNTSEGMLSKTWVRVHGIPHLLKGGGLYNQEPYNEVVATWLHSGMLAEDEYVPYEIAKFTFDTVSSCPCFVTSQEEYIPAHYILTNAKQPEYRTDYQQYVESCFKLGVEDVENRLWYMIVCDDLLANTDRHWRNFGLIRDVETLEYKVAPLFDSGTSLWSNIHTRDMEWSSHDFISKPFDTGPNAQLRYVRDFSWVNFNKLLELPDAAVSILEDNPLLDGRLDFIYEGIRNRARHLEAVAG